MRITNFTINTKIKPIDNLCGIKTKPSILLQLAIRKIICRKKLYKNLNIN